MSEKKPSVLAILKAKWAEILKDHRALMDEADRRRNRKIIDEKCAEPVSEAEKRFKDAVRILIRIGLHPTPTLLNRQVTEMGGKRHRRMNNLNTRELIWLRRELKVPATKGFAYERCPWNCCARNGACP